ncbi:MAG: efflux RND transporter periplasmic adaptor subunit [Myxococcales bacterium]|nr:efflux RND transporter periplasmic adaptor subunit [Myxococcales bacterium]
MKKFILALLILAGGLGGLLYTQLARQRATETAPAGGSGVIEGTTVAVVPRLGARITAIHVREGDAVKAGQALVELDCTEPRAAEAEATAAVAAAEAGLAAAQAQVEAAEAAAQAAHAGIAGAKAAERGAQAGARGVRAKAQVAQRTARRVETLQRGGQATELKLDEARSTVDVLAAERRAREAQVAGARAQLGAAEAQAQAAQGQVHAAKAKLQAVAQDGARARAALTRAQALVAECTLKAPTDAVVQIRAAEPGELARPGLALLTLVDAREVTATFFLPNAELAAAKPGAPVQVKADAWPDRAWAGTVTRVGAEAAFTPRNVQTRSDRDRLVYPVDVRLANADGALRPGMPVEVVLPGTEPGGQGPTP